MSAAVPGSRALTFAAGAAVGALAASAVAFAAQTSAARRTSSSASSSSQPSRCQESGEKDGCGSCPNEACANKLLDKHPAPTASVPEEEEAHDHDVPVDAPEDCPGVLSKAAGKAAGCSGCPNQVACASGEAKIPDPAISSLKTKFSNVKRKIMVLSGKGGVGKSTVSTQLAFAMAERRMDTGLLDVDITGPSVPRMLGLLGQNIHAHADGWQPVYVDDKLGVMSIGFMLENQDDAVIWRGPRKSGLIKQFLLDVQWGDLDCLIIDTPPGTSDEHISLVQFLKESSADGAVIVTTPQEVSLMDVRKEISFCKKLRIPIIGVIENMSGFACPSCGHVEHIFSPSTGGAEEMCKQMKIPFLGRIPLDGRVAKAGDAGLPFSQLHPDGAVAKCIDDVISAILRQTDAKS